VTAAETLKLAALMVPLGLDTFGVALALGIAGLPQPAGLKPWRRRQVLFASGMRSVSEHHTAAFEPTGDSSVKSYVPLQQLDLGADRREPPADRVYAPARSSRPDIEQPSG
jgi:hypothetical protein